MRGTLTAIIKNLEPGGGVEKQARRLASKSKRAIISKFTDTKGRNQPAKSKFRTQKYGGTGSLLQAIERQKPVVEWTGKGLRVQVLDLDQLPFYWRVQEFGFKAATWTWRQRFYIVRYRPKSKPSKRGDLFVLRSKRGRSKGKHIYLTVSHKKGMVARHFIRAGRNVLKLGRRSISPINPGQDAPVDV